MSAKADLARKVKTKFQGFTFQSKPYRNFETFLLELLLTVELHNQLLVYRQLNIFALGQCQDTPFVIVAINFEPSGRVAVRGEFLCLLENRQLAAGLANHNLVANADL